MSLLCCSLFSLLEDHMQNFLTGTLFMCIGVVGISLLNAPETNCQAVVPMQATSAGPAMVSEHTGKRVDERNDEATRLSALEVAVRDQHAQLEELRKLIV